MQIRNKLKVNWYVFGTMLNILWAIIFLGFEKTPFLLAFILMILLNQYFLAIIVSDMTGIEKNTSLIPTWMCGALKLLVLVVAFYFGIRLYPASTLFLVGIYIFQLIILVISIKRIVKKN
ncbi:MAG: hypothetical protein QF441_15180 [Bacteriovoracaceae bacterium]|jgi:hypothetical protein|nr:hypothetical protein [Halobacteriovoraceae bacterium]MDP7321949.1 hypothetical protein [Bacteriovoracaceae bacterium]